MTTIPFKDVNPVRWWLLPAQGHFWAGEACCFYNFFHQHREVQKPGPVLFECQVPNIWWQWQLHITHRGDLFSLSLHAYALAAIFSLYPVPSSSYFCAHEHLYSFFGGVLLLFLTYGAYMIHHWVQPCPLNKQKIPYVLEGGISYTPFSLSLSFKLSQLELYFWTAVTMQHCKLKTTTWALPSKLWVALILSVEER